MDDHIQKQLGVLKVLLQVIRLSFEMVQGFLFLVKALFIPLDHSIHYGFIVLNHLMEARDMWIE
jgi:hypothetical protein